MEGKENGMTRNWMRAVWAISISFAMASCGRDRKPVEGASPKEMKETEKKKEAPPPPAPPAERKLRVFSDAVGFGLLQPEDVAAAMSGWGLDVGKLRSRPVGVALFVGADDRFDAAFWDDRGNAWEGRSRCIEDQGRCWYVREDFTPSGRLEEKTLQGEGSRLVVLLSHPRMAPFWEAHPKLASLGIGELRLGVAGGRIEVEASAAKSGDFRNAADAAHYWWMLAVNERARFLQADPPGQKFFEVLPRAKLEVKKNTILFSMEGDCAMLAWSLRAMHQLYPFLRP